MAKDLEYFDDFFAAPELMKAKEFYHYVHEWLAYLKEHEGEFNYLEDEEWAERKDRVLAVLTRQEDLKEEFEELEEKLESINEYTTSEEKIAIYKQWLAFIKANQENYGFSDKDLLDIEKKTKDAIISHLDVEVAEERLKGSRARYKKSVEELDEKLAGYYLRTGKRPVLTSIRLKKLKGN